MYARLAVQILSRACKRTQFLLEPFDYSRYHLSYVVSCVCVFFN